MGSFRGWTEALTPSRRPQPEHCRRAKECKADRRPQLQGPSGRRLGNQIDLINGKGPVGSCHEIPLFSTESTLSAVRIDDYKSRFLTDQPQGWFGIMIKKLTWPILTNLRIDPFERTGMPRRRQRPAARLSATGSSRRVLAALCSGPAGSGQAWPRLALEFPADAEGGEL